MSSRLALPLVCATALGCASSPAAHGRTETREVVISVVGLNDLHGRLSALPAFGGYVDSLRELRQATGGDVVVVDAGDMLQGTLASNLDEGASVVRAYNTLGFAAVALGNHEFDFGPIGTPSGGGADALASDVQGALKARILEANFPVLSANLVDRKSGAPVAWPKLERSVLMSVAGVPVGIVGALTEETPGIVMRDYFAGLDVSSLAEAVTEQAVLLRQLGARLVIVLAHAGAKCERFENPHDLSSCDDAEIFKVARSLEPGLVDVIVAGHTHAGVAHLVRNIAIVEAYASGRAFSRVDVVFDRGRGRVLDKTVFPPEPLCPDVGDDSCVPGPYAGVSVRANAVVERAVQPALARARAEKDAPLGVRLDAALVHEREAESPLGNLFADLMLEAVPGADVAIANGGSLRADLPARALSYGDLYEAMPFDNRLATLELIGAELERVLLAHLSRREHGIVSIAGLRVIGRCDKARLNLVLLRRDGSHVGPDDRLTIVTSDYLATGGDELFTAGLDGKTKLLISGRLVRSALLDGLRRRAPLLRSNEFAVSAERRRLQLPAARPVLCSVKH